MTSEEQQRLVGSPRGNGGSFLASFPPACPFPFFPFSSSGADLSVSSALLSRRPSALLGDRKRTPHWADHAGFGSRLRPSDESMSGRANPCSATRTGGAARARGRGSAGHEPMVYRSIDRSITRSPPRCCSRKTLFFLRRPAPIHPPQSRRSASPRFDPASCNCNATALAARSFQLRPPLSSLARRPVQLRPFLPPPPAPARAPRWPC
jgi:hypothetical protein